MRDSEGFVWISTQDGLTKYNGSQYIQYNYNRRDKNSIAQNYVWTTFEDTKSNIWIALFGGGLCRFDKKQNKFFRYDDFGTIANHGIRTFQQLNDSTLIVGTDHGLYLFDLISYSFDPDTSFQQNQFEAGHIHSHSIEISGTDILVAGENGGFILSPLSKDVSKIDASSLGVKKIKFIKKINQGKFLLADENIILEVAYNQPDKSFDIIREMNSSTRISINDASIDNSGEILLACEEGLYKLNFEEQTLYPIPNDQPDKNNLEDKVAYCIEEIEPNLMWIGTKTHIYEFSESKKPFHSILSEEFCGSAVLGITEDNEDNLWIATRRGLGRIKNFSQPKNKWEYFCYDKSSNPEIRNEYMLNIKSMGNMLLVGYRKNGFSIIELGNDDKITFKNPPKVVDEFTNTVSVSNFHLDKNDHIWISTSANGVIRWPYKDPFGVKMYKNKDGQTNVLSHNYTFGFEELDDNWIAIATAAGISLIHQNNDSTYQILSGLDSFDLSGNFIMDFHRDSEGRLWVCTDGGINLWKKDNTFQSWTKNEGLPNDIIYGMLEHENELWISSNKGLVRMQNLPIPEFKVFSIEDDVLNDEHNQFSFYKSKNDRLLFGGKKGITFFNTKDIKPNPIYATPIIESFQLFNKNGNSRIINHINYMDQLVLNHDENFLSFDLASLSYYNSEQNQYRYKLSPLNDSWKEMGKRNYFSLNGLAPGHYTLSIQSSNNDGIWGKTVKSIDIFIKRPIYSRWYAWVLYALTFFGIVYAFYKMRINHITNLTAAREEERIKIRERSARDFHDEVGSLVTKLSLLNQYALSNIPKEDEENIGTLNKMQSNIQRIRTGMKDFIWVLDPSKDSFHSAIIKIREVGNDLFEYTGIKFQCNVDKSVNKDLTLNGVQRRQLILLLKEAFHNVIKHAEAKKCTVGINQTDITLNFDIVDDGIGYDQNSIAAGYGLRSMKERTRKMDGEIVTKSSKNNGTSISVKIPTHPNGL